MVGRQLMNVLHRLYEQLLEEIRLQSTRIGIVTKLMAAYADQLPVQYEFENMKQFTREGAFVTRGTASNPSNAGKWWSP